MPQQKKPSSKKPRKLTATVVDATDIEAGPSPSDDDEAPEEVTLASGKQQQQLSRKLERSQAKAQKVGKREAAVSKHTAREEQRVQQKASSGKRKKPNPQGDEDDAEGHAGVDLLPESITAALAAYRQDAAATRQQQAAIIDAALKEQQATARKKRKPLVSVKKGPVTVAVLKPDVQQAPATAHFLREQLYAGSRLTRSAELLVAGGGAKTQASRAGRLRPALEFAPTSQAVPSATG